MAKGVRCLNLPFSFDVGKHIARPINRDYGSSKTGYGHQPDTNGSLTVLIGGKNRYRL